MDIYPLADTPPAAGRPWGLIPRLWEYQERFLDMESPSAVPLSMDLTRKIQTLAYFSMQLGEVGASQNSLDPASTCRISQQINCQYDLSSSKQVYESFAIDSAFNGMWFPVVDARSLFRGPIYDIKSGVPNSAGSGSSLKG